MGATVYFECDRHVQYDEGQIRIHEYFGTLHKFTYYIFIFNRYQSVLIICVNCITPICKTGFKVLSEICLSTDSALRYEPSESFNE